MAKVSAAWGGDWEPAFRWRSFLQSSSTQPLPTWRLSKVSRKSADPNDAESPSQRLPGVLRLGIRDQENNGKSGSAAWKIQHGIGSHTAHDASRSPLISPCDPPFKGITASAR